MNNDNDTQSGAVESEPVPQLKPIKRVNLRVSALVWLLIATAALSAFAGWRVMIRVWPAVKPYVMEYVVYKVAPSLRPEPAYSEIELYTALSTATIDDAFGENDTVIYYFYKDYCPYCRYLSPLFEGIPSQITLPDGTVSKIRIVSLEKQDERSGEIIAAYYTAHQIAEDRQYVPAVVIGGLYLHGGDEIMGSLWPAITSGEGLKTQTLGGNTRG